MRTRHVTMLLASVVVPGAAALALIDLKGLSTRSAPSAMERAMARSARRWAAPRRMRAAPNPIVFSPEVWTDARAHFADHCATCHANDGSGDTEMGRNMYPKAPDMRLSETQRLTDGELYWIIENGVRLSGMPAWGDGSDTEAASWKLVHFIRRLADLTPAQILEMQALNPKTPSELEEEREDRDFLQGKDPDTTAKTPSPHQHKE